MIDKPNPEVIRRYAQLVVECGTHNTLMFLPNLSISCEDVHPPLAALEVSTRMTGKSRRT